MNTETALELRQVRKEYPAQGRHGCVVALDTLDLKVCRGEWVAVVGPSGCGKSTLIDLMAGFIMPTSGAIWANGEPVRGPSPQRMVVFQDHAVFPWYTALGNVAYGLRRQGVARREARARATEALDRMGLSDFLHAYPASLSGGMRQRVALARALVSQTDILLLDEPFASLDTITRARLQDELSTLWEEFGWTVVFVTHNLAESVYLADRVVVLDHSPAGLRGIESVELPRPRVRRDPCLIAQVERLDAWMREGKEERRDETGLGPFPKNSLEE